jgi:hypothetical protein
MVNGLILLMFLNISHSETFKYSNGLEISANSYRQAAKICYNVLSNGKYPGEETGLKIIDICANPKK